MAALTCHYCEQHFALTNGGSTRDHIIPISLGGAMMPRADRNIVRACRECNGSKSSGLLPDHCGICERAHEMFREWLVVLAVADEQRAKRMLKAYERADRLTLMQVIGQPRWMLMQHSARPA